MKLLKINYLVFPVAFLPATMHNTVNTAPCCHIRGMHVTYDHGLHSYNIIGASVSH